METGSVSVRIPRPSESEAVRGLLQRWFYVALALLMTVFVTVGFWASYFGPLLQGAPVTVPWVVHVHAAVFMGWMLLLVTQVALVATGRTNAHIRMGRFGIAYGCLVLVVGLVVSFAAPALHLAAGEWPLDQAAGFLLVPLGDAVLFGGFFLAAVHFRQRPAIHKRLMVLATVALLLAASARLVGPPMVAPGATLLLWLSPLAVAMVFDLVVERRVHAVYLIGGCVLLLGYLRIFFMDSEAWLRIGRSVMTAFT